MDKKPSLSIQTQFLISLVVAVAFLAATVERDLIQGVFILIASITGTIVMDLEYFLYAYVFEPGKGFSKNLRQYITDKDYRGALKYVYYNKNEVVDKSINSALFQIIFGVLTLLVAFTSTTSVLTAFIFSIFANSIYKMWEHYFSGQSNEWFWAFKTKPKERGVVVYSILMIGLLALSFAVV